VSTEIQTWYDFVLAQMASDSYLDIDLTDPNKLKDALRNGANHRDFIAELEPEELSATRMTNVMIDDFLGRWEVIDQLMNTTTSGFSATLLKNKTTPGEYTLSFRSTESKPASKGGDFERDGGSGADGEILDIGLAWAQIRDMEAYYAQLKSGQLSTDGATSEDGAAVAQYLADGGKLSITGYSLGAHLAQVFTLLLNRDGTAW
jgi:hypothetical protein